MSTLIDIGQQASRSPIPRRSSKAMDQGEEPEASGNEPGDGVIWVTLASV